MWIGRKFGRGFQSCKTIVVSNLIPLVPLSGQASCTCDELLFGVECANVNAGRHTTNPRESTGMRFVYGGHNMCTIVCVL